MKNTNFCQKLLSFFAKNSKAIVNLIVALASNSGAKSVTELALNPLYFFQYSSICDAIDNVFKFKLIEATPEKKLIERLDFDKKSQLVFKEFLPPLWKNKYRLLNNDVTPIIRAYSPTLEDKEFVHTANNVISSNKPISIGVNLSVIGLSARENDVSWNLPLSMLKVPINMKASEFSAKQLEIIVKNKELFENDTFINTSDSAYCNKKFIYPIYHFENLINIIRIAGHRNVFHQFEGEQHDGRGRHTEYGNVFKLKDTTTNSQPNQTDEFEIVLKKKQRKCKAIAKQYNNMIIRGSNACKMSNKPFNLISIEVFDIQTNEKVFTKTLWLTVWGQKRNEITIKEVYEAFRLRFDIEFFFRFGKQKLLLDKYQTPDTKHLENWFEIVKHAYWLLYLSRNDGENIVHKWEKYLPKYNDQNVKELDILCTKTPTQTQRAMPVIICEFAKKHLIPKTRNKSSGRIKGEKQPPRKRFEVVKKGKTIQNLTAS
jgi:hypothetical protein